MHFHVALGIKEHVYENEKEASDAEDASGEDDVIDLVEEQLKKALTISKVKAFLEILPDRGPTKLRKLTFRTGETLRRF